MAQHQEQGIREWIENSIKDGKTLDTIIAEQEGSLNASLITEFYHQIIQEQEQQPSTITGSSSFQTGKGRNMKWTLGQDTSVAEDGLDSLLPSSRDSDTIINQKKRSYPRHHPMNSNMKWTMEQDASVEDRLDSPLPSSRETSKKFTTNPHKQMKYYPPVNNNMKWTLEKDATVEDRLDSALPSSRETSSSTTYQNKQIMNYSHHPVNNNMKWTLEKDATVEDRLDSPLPSSRDSQQQQYNKSYQHVHANHSINKTWNATTVPYHTSNRKPNMSWSLEKDDSSSFVTEDSALLDMNNNQQEMKNESDEVQYPTLPTRRKPVKNTNLKWTLEKDAPIEDRLDSALPTSREETTKRIKTQHPYSSSSYNSRPPPSSSNNSQRYSNQKWTSSSNTGRFGNQTWTKDESEKIEKLSESLPKSPPSSNHV